MLTFDQSYMGDSAGFPRHLSSPDIFTENFSAGVDYLGLLPFVDRESIGAIGICGSGGFALSAAQCDVRIKAVAALSMYDMSVAVRGNMDKQALQKRKETLAQQRWIDAEWFRFYAVERGHHPNARGGFTTTSDLPMMNFPLLQFIDEISPRPVLFVIGDRAHSRFFSEIAYEKAQEPKELYVSGMLFLGLTVLTDERSAKK